MVRDSLWCVIVYASLLGQNFAEAEQQYASLKASTEV
jgi:hypothetical protein